MIDKLASQWERKGWMRKDSSDERSVASAPGFWVAGHVVFVWQWKSSKGHYWR